MSKARPGDNEHPTQKPVELFARPMRRHTRVGAVCFEPFSGSGTQIIAAEQLGRRCCAIELEPVFVDVAVRRWQRLTGLEAVLEGTSKTWRQIAAERGVELPPTPGIASPPAPGSAPAPAPAPALAPGSVAPGSVAPGSVAPGKSLLGAVSPGEPQAAGGASAQRARGPKVRTAPEPSGERLSGVGDAARNPRLGARGSQRKPRKG